jgi:hypothetical protein
MHSRVLADTKQHSDRYEQYGRGGSAFDQVDGVSERGRNGIMATANRRSPCTALARAISKQQRDTLTAACLGRVHRRIRSA